MDKDLLPWILGGALITTGAIAGAIRYSAQHPAMVATRTVPVPSAGSVAPAATPVPAASNVPAAVPEPTPPSDAALQAQVAPSSGSAASSPPLPAGEIWQCSVNGQKVFSDTRCGSGAAVKQLGDLNVMDVPPPQYSNSMPVAYGQPYMPYPSAAPYPDDEADGGDVSGDTYPSEIIVARERARRAHRIHQSLPPRSAPPSPPVHHGSAAPRATH